ncbi:MAG: UDP-3-O-(3-hydroxymyristoyl)glucosamine N-acyltransferase [Verrucomicrobia subdivision 3 bacterium]|nr:UDP-3-O-(3-hydroxymyristoyl)glucosamine N-acyltransferase [Limisphaerales bacterium]
MSEPIYYRRAIQTALAEIVACTGAAVAEGADLSLVIRGVAALEEAGAGELTYCDTPQDAVHLEASRATACFVAPALAPRVPQPTLALVMEEPYMGFAIAVRRLFPQALRPDSPFGTAGINPGASIHPEARLEQGVIVDPGVVIGPRAEIGSGSMIGANSVIGADVRIGRDCMIWPQVTISHALIGNRVYLHPGVRIGQSSVRTGGAQTSREIAKAPSIGRVILQDGVELGANSTLDRGAVGDTVIGEESRVGSLVQIGENVTIGRCCTVPAQTKISDGARLADFSVASSE